MLYIRLLIQLVSAPSTLQCSCTGLSHIVSYVLLLVAK